MIRPMPRLRRLPAAAPILGLLALLGAACGGTPAAVSPTGGYHWTGAELVHPLAKPEFTLTDQRGQPYDFQKETAGKVAVLYFGYTNCPDVCPENMTLLAIALKQVTAAVRSHVVVLFVTTDPARDSPPVLAAYLAKYDPSFVGLTGTKAELDLAQSEAQVTLASPEPAAPGAGYSVDHAAQMIAYTPDNLAHISFFQGMPAAGVAHDLTRLVTRGWSAG